MIAELDKIHEWLSSAQSIVITAGAGIGADSGLATYRGEEGQWGKVETDSKQSVFEVVNPTAFVEHPGYGWKMYANRLLEYTHTVPHEGFTILLKWIKQYGLEYFVLTSNIDQQFLKAGFEKDRIRELHGSLFYLQCSKPCSHEIWEHGLDLQNILSDIDKGIYPLCPNCGKLSRPNVYMFRDGTYLAHRSNEQEIRFQQFLKRVQGRKMLVFEIGSGPHVQSIRKKTRMLGIEYHANIIRINPQDAKIKTPHIGLDMGALQALLEIDDFIQHKTHQGDSPGLLERRN